MCGAKREGKRKNNSIFLVQYISDKSIFRRYACNTTEDGRTSSELLVNSNTRWKFNRSRWKPF